MIKTFNLRHLILISAISIMLVQCKSAEVTFLGFYSVKYTNDHAAPAEKTKFQYAEPLNPLALTVSGLITDRTSKPVSQVELFLMKEQKIEYHTVSLNNGVFILKDVTPDVYSVYMIAPGNAKQHKTVNNVAIECEDNQLNLTF